MEVSGAPTTQGEFMTANTDAKKSVQERYYYVDAKKHAVGPFSFEVMLRLASVGKLDEETPVAHEGQAKWMTWSQLLLEASPAPSNSGGLGGTERSSLPTVPGPWQESAPPSVEMKSHMVPDIPPLHRQSAAKTPSAPLPATELKAPRTFHARHVYDSMLRPMVSKAWAGLRSLPRAALGVLGLMALAVLGAIGVELWRTPPSLANDEIQTPKKLQADHAQWRRFNETLASTGLTAWKTGPSSNGGDGISWRQRLFEIPHERSVRAALERRLPPDITLRDFVPTSVVRSDDGMTVTYRVTLRMNSSQYWVPVEDIRLSQPEFSKYQRFGGYVVASEDLPPGKRYVLDQKKMVAMKGTDFQFPWTVRRAAVEGGRWKILDAEPIPFERNPAFERGLFDPGHVVTAGARPVEPQGEIFLALPTRIGRVPLLRSENELRQGAAYEDREIQSLSARVRSIEEQVGRLRQQLAATLPPRPQRDNSSFGGSGSGEPTKTGVRVGGGAAGGAAIGAMAGKTEGAGWGALGGAIAGGIYDAVSKSNDRKRFEARKQREYEERMAPYDAAKRKMDAEVSRLESELVSSLEQELKEKARQQMLKEQG